MTPHVAILLTRRQWVQTLLATTAGMTGAVSLGACMNVEGVGTLPQAWRTPALLDALGAERVRRIGAAWRAQHPNERSLTDLRTALERRLSIPRSEQDSAPTNTIARTVTDDFEHERIVIVDGWLLAVTEARQCALYHLTTA